MTTKFIDYREAMTRELTGFIRSQADALSLTDLDRMVVDLPALGDRLAEIPSQTYPYLREQLAFLSLFVAEQVGGRSPDLAEQPVAEAAFALLYFQRAIDLIPDAIPGIGMLDDAMIVAKVLRRQEHAFKQSSHAYMLCWPEPKFEVDDLLSVISPLRITSFCASSGIRPSA
ncbi:MAG TPA: YkvA family protein [Chthoniobacterales bacterium]|nr:YkvA family protein [Chthoniobacterales bacterium]